MSKNSKLKDLISSISQESHKDKAYSLSNANLKNVTDKANKILDLKTNLKTFEDYRLEIKAKYFAKLIKDNPKDTKDTKDEEDKEDTKDKEDKKDKENNKKENNNKKNKQNKEDNKKDYKKKKNKQNKEDNKKDYKKKKSKKDIEDKNDKKNQEDKVDKIDKKNQKDKKDKEDKKEEEDKKNEDEIFYQLSMQTLFNKKMPFISGKKMITRKSIQIPDNQYFISNIFKDLLSIIENSKKIGYPVDNSYGLAYFGNQEWLFFLTKEIHYQKYICDSSKVMELYYEDFMRNIINGKNDLEEDENCILPSSVMGLNYERNVYNYLKLKSQLTEGPDILVKLNSYNKSNEKNFIQGKVSFEKYFNLIKNGYFEIDGSLINDNKGEIKIDNSDKPFIAFEEIFVEEICDKKGNIKYYECKIADEFINEIIIPNKTVVFIQSKMQGPNIKLKATQEELRKEILYKDEMKKELIVVLYKMVLYGDYFFHLYKELEMIDKDFNVLFLLIFDKYSIKNVSYYIKDYIDLLINEGYVYYPFTIKPIYMISSIDLINSNLTLDNYKNEEKRKREEEEKRKREEEEKRKMEELLKKFEEEKRKREEEEKMKMEELLKKFEEEKRKREEIEKKIEEEEKRKREEEEKRKREEEEKRKEEKKIKEELTKMIEEKKIKEKEDKKKKEEEEIKRKEETKQLKEEIVKYKKLFNEKQEISLKELLSMEECNEEMEKLINNSKKDIENFLSMKFTIFEPIGYKIKKKIDNKISYAFKVKIGAQKYVHINIIKSVQGETEIGEIIFGKNLFDEI